MITWLQQYENWTKANAETFNKDITEILPKCSLKHAVKAKQSINNPILEKIALIVLWTCKMGCY